MTTIPEPPSRTLLPPLPVFAAPDTSCAPRPPALNVALPIELNKPGPGVKETAAPPAPPPPPLSHPLFEFIAGGVPPANPCPDVPAPPTGLPLVTSPPPPPDPPAPPVEFRVPP